MKRFLIYFSFSALFFSLLISCQKEASLDNNELHDQVSRIGDKLTFFHPSLADETVKAYADFADGGKVVWEDGDKVMVLNGENAVVFKYSASRKEFRISYEDNPQEYHAGIEYKYSCGFAFVYPAASYVSQSMIDDKIQAVINLPSTQTHCASGKERVLNNPMMATANPQTWTSKIYFKNLCGILKFPVKGNYLKDRGSIANIVLSTSLPKANGNFTVACSSFGNDFAPTLNYVSNGVDNNTLDMSAVTPDSNSDAVSNIYFFLPPDDYPGGGGQQYKSHNQLHRRFKCRGQGN